jgi:hypothetical protein
MFSPSLGAKGPLPLKMEGACTYATSVTFYTTTRGNNPGTKLTSIM